MILFADHHHHFQMKSLHLARKTANMYDIDLGLIQLGCLISFPQIEEQVSLFFSSVLCHRLPLPYSTSSIRYSVIPTSHDLYIRRSMHVINDRMQREVYVPALR